MSYFFSKEVGNFKAEAYSGWPVWVKLTFGDDCISLRGSDDVRDLQYLLERALEFAETEEKRRGG